MDTLAQNTESYQFHLRHLFYSMTAIAVALSIAKLLGAPFGWITLCPFAILFAQVSLTSNKLDKIAAIGFVFGSLGGGLMVDWPLESINFYKASFTLGMFGSSIVSAIHLLWLQRRFLGVTTLIASSVVLLYVIFGVIPVP